MPEAGPTPAIRHIAAVEWLIAGALVLCAIVSAFVTPLFEAPDEAAHLTYAAHVSKAGSLPPIPAAGEYDRLNYEAHQPPLAYWFAAAVIRLTGERVPDVAAEANPGFSFHEPGSRMFRKTPAAESDWMTAARMTGAVWLAISLLAMLLALQLYVASPLVRAAALACLAGGPQYIWLSGVMNNDGALVAMSSWAILALLITLRTADRRWGVAAVAASCLAVLAKGSGLFLAGGLLLCGAMLIVRRSTRTGFLLAAGALVSPAIFGLQNYLRTGSASAPLPVASGGGWMSLIENPDWPARVMYSFWAKFGWMNTPLPRPWYLWFAVVSIAATYGAFLVLRKYREEGFLMLALACGNLAVLVIYMATVDFQTQGRYLHPVLIVLVVFAGAALSRVRSSRLLYVALILGVAAPYAGILTVWRAFHAG